MPSTRLTSALVLALIVAPSGATAQIVIDTIPATFPIRFEATRPSACWRVERPADGRLTAQVTGPGAWSVCIGHQQCPTDCFDAGLRQAQAEPLTEGPHYFVRAETTTPGVTATLKMFATAAGGGGGAASISGAWTYDGPYGAAQVTAAAGRVGMQFTNARRSAAGPHYVLEGTIAAGVIKGTWRFVVAPLPGADARFAPVNCKNGSFSATVSGDGTTIRFHGATDPCGHGFNGLVLLRTPGGGQGLPSLTGTWKYDDPNGTTVVSQVGNRVTLQATNRRRPAPGPHYRLEGTLSGRTISGTWKFVVSPLVGPDTRFAGANCKGGTFSAEASADGRSLRFFNVQDPCNHSLNGAVMRR